MSKVTRRDVGSLVLLLLFQPCHTWADELRGMIDVRAISSDSQHSWTRAGLGKSRYDSDSSGLSVGQATLLGEIDLPQALSAVASVATSNQRASSLDIREAWLGWNPVPESAWKIKAKVGAFFPPSSLEIEYDSIGWTPTRTVSSSAINSWIGEELRTTGVEFQLSRAGRFEQSPHDLGLTFALFQGSDPAGTLLGWRGWSISDQIAGRSAPTLLADLPVYHADGGIPKQSRTIHPYREIDGRVGYYLGAQYRYQQWVELAWLRYDNRADQLIVKDGQYAWYTRFDHVNAIVRFNEQWELLFQNMRGATSMGKTAVALDYRAWFALLSRPLGAGRISLRYDRFGTQEHDNLPSDPNSERGQSVALAYTLPLSDSVTLLTEALMIKSQRGSRSLVGEPTNQVERSVTTSLRWQF